jgi:hypothetical protein
MAEKGMDSWMVSEVIRWTGNTYRPAWRKYNQSDYPHKIKNFSTGVINQQSKTSAVGQSPDRIVKWEVLIQIARSDMLAFCRELEVLNKRHDDMDAVAMSSICRPHFVSAVRDAGHWECAAVLQAFYRVHQLFDSRGLSLATRHTWAAEFTVLFREAFQPYWHQAQALPMHVLGIATINWMATMNNVVSRSMLHVESISRGPGACRPIMDRAMSTYDVENSFSTTTMLGCYKPDARIHAGIMTRSARVQTIRNNPNRGFHWKRSKRSRYNQKQDNEIQVNGQAPWNTSESHGRFPSWKHPVTGTVPTIQELRNTTEKDERRPHTTRQDQRYDRLGRRDRNGARGINPTPTRVYAWQRKLRATATGIREEIQSDAGNSIWKFNLLPPVV